MAPLSTQLSCDFITARIAMQENKVTDFTNNLALFIIVNSNVISQVSAWEKKD